MRPKTCALAITVLLTLSARAGAVSEIPLGTRLEAQFASAAEHENPVQDAQVEVEFTPASGVRSIAGEVRTAGRKEFDARAAGDRALVLRGIPE